MKICDGEIKATNLPPRNKHTQNEAFIRYLSIFYDRPDVKVMCRVCHGHLLVVTHFKIISILHFVHYLLSSQH